MVAVNAATRTIIQHDGPDNLGLCVTQSLHSDFATEPLANGIAPPYLESLLLPDEVWRTPHSIKNYNPTRWP